MFQVFGPKIRDSIIKTLALSPISSTELISLTQSSIPRTNRQSVYRVLKEMLDAGVIIKKKGVISLHFHWLHELRHFVDKAESALLAQNEFSRFLYLKPGERITYSFATPELLDTFWVQALELFLAKTPPEVPFVAYDSHNWTALARDASEHVLRVISHATEHEYFQTDGHNYPLDQKVRRDYRTHDNIHYNLLEEPMDKRINYHVCIFDDFLIEVFVDKKISEEIHKIFQTRSDCDHDCMKHLANLLQKKSKNRLVVSRNADKARKLSKKLLKDFA